MPELPEVETIKNELLPWVVAQHFTRVTILDAKLISGISVEEFCRRLVGQTIKSLERRGKYLVFCLREAKSLIVHLKMSGTLLLNAQEIDRYARAIFDLSNGIRLLFRDPRRFGVVRLVADANDILYKLGPEPLGEDFIPHALALRLSKHHIPIKAALVDQSLIAGIGNMYADEALFVAKIHPLKKANNLSPEEIETLYRSIQEVLCSAINNKGASVNTYVRPRGELGTAHLSFKVAHRGGKPCPVCGTPIQRILVRNRGSCFCPNCQRITA